jgi:type I restriction enzyme S subunit
MSTEWRLRPLGEVAHVEMGQSPPSEHVSEKSESGLAFLQGNAEFSDLYPHPRLRCSKPLKKAKNGDALISVRAPVGAINRADQDYCIGRGLAAIRFIHADPDYGYHALAFVASNLRKVAQGTTFEAVGGKDLRGLEFPDSPPHEQRRIADILDTLDEAIRRTEQVIAKLQQMKQGLLHDLLTRGIDENGELRDPERHPEQFKESPLGRIPREWEVVKLASLGSFMNGINKPKHAFGQGTKFVNISDVYPEQLDTSGLGGVSISAVEQERYRLIPGDVLIDRSSVKLEGVGYPTVFKKSDEAVIFCGFIIRFRPNDPEQGLFLCRQMRSRPFRLQVFKVATASANVNVNQAALGNLLLAMPTKIERVRIAEAEAIGNARIPKEQAQLAKLRSLKQGLMDDLLTGRVRVAVPEEATS